MRNHGKWTLVDALNRPPWLGVDDRCYYYHVYTPHAKYDYSTGNQAIYNYKKTIRQVQSDTRLRYWKDDAIKSFADAMYGLICKGSGADGMPLLEYGSRLGLVPVPPSKRPDHPEYDDRNVRVCHLVAQMTGCAVCRDLETAINTQQAHLSSDPSARNVSLVEKTIERVAYGSNACEIVFVVDDVLTMGTHYVAAKNILRGSGCEARIYGIFFARAMYSQ